jgi:Amt family ammonium transporter
MVWGGGYLASKGVIDFAGGLVVHATCGIGALVIAIYLGKRDGFLEKPMPPHNRTMVMIGASMLWVGWFGFNAGSAVAADGNAGMAMLVTHISAALGALTWMAIEWLKSGKATIVGIATGMVAGLATITPASGTVGPAGAMLIGVLAGSICFYATQLVKSYFKVDDSLDVFPVHGVGGILGIIMLSLVGTPGGFLGNGSTGFDNTTLAQLLIQLEGIFVICAWTGIATYVILKILNIFVDIRVTKDEEEEGLDVSLHNEQGYNL